MQWIEAKDAQEMSVLAAQLIINQVRENPKTVLGLATGGTPVGTYAELVREAKVNGTDYQQVTTFNLDEYVGIAPGDRNSYRFYMGYHLFNHVNFARTHLPDGMASDLSLECVRYEERIADAGGIDLQLLGIGTNGHIGFNEPGTSFQSTTHVVALTEATRQANARFFDHPGEVPTHAITMGIATIMKSKQIILLASGGKKADILYRLATGEVDEQVPASILKQHAQVTIIADAAALQKVKERESCSLR